MPLRSPYFAPLAAMASSMVPTTARNQLAPNASVSGAVATVAGSATSSGNGDGEGDGVAALWI